MEKISKRSALRAVLVFLLLVCAYAARMLAMGQETDIETVLQLSRHLIHVGLVVLWITSIKRRILQREVRKYLILTAGLLVFWLYIRTVKWMFLSNNDWPNRCCWYAFYIPITLIPLFGVFLVQYIGKPEDYKLPGWMKLWYIPAIALILLVFTNDIHRQVFDFPNGIIYSDSNYVYGNGYYLIMAWFVFLGLYFVGMLLKKSRVPGNRWFQSLPLLVMIGALVLWGLYDLKLIRYDLTAMSCLIIILLLESSIQSGLIRSNSHYETLFRISSIEAQIVDENYQVRYASENAVPLLKDIMRQTEKGPVILGEKRLSSEKISYGRVLWCDDITEINRVTKVLEEVREKLAKSNDLLQSELDLKEKQLRIMEKNRLYDRVLEDVSDKLDQLENLILDVSALDEKEKLTRIAVISVYVKRRSNLLLIAENQTQISSREMEFCLRESLDHIRLSGALCALDCSCTESMEAEYLVGAYDFFEQAVEQILPGLQAFLVKARLSGQDIFLRLQIDSEVEGLNLDETAWNALGGSVEQRREDGILWIEIFLTKGGVST